MSKRILVACAVALGVSSAVLSYRFSKARAQAAVWTPFTAAMVERHDQRQPAAPLRIENYIYARRGDGSWVREMKRQIMPNGGWGNLRVVMNYSAGTRTAVDPSTRSITTYHYPQSRVDQLSVPPAACSEAPSVQHATVAGYDTVEVQRTLGQPSGAVAKITDWEAPALNCLPLKEIATYRCQAYSPAIKPRQLPQAQQHPSTRPAVHSNEARGDSGEASRRHC